MELQTLLTGSPPHEWTTRQAIVFDWYDGPREGICALKKPGVEFYFHLLWERHNPADLDDRYFRVGEIPIGTVDTLLELLRDVGTPAATVWIPLWRFPTEGPRASADRFVEEIKSKARPTNMIIATRDMETFLDQWTVCPEDFSEKDPEGLITCREQHTS